MSIPLPATEDTVELSRRALAKYDADLSERRERRLYLSKETGYAVLGPGTW